ncbi:MAG: hypothetical protein IPN73_16280 [Saprospiraceae bacterium]|nr:hypothetical protein [Saprospiraceae bacterium]MBL0084605.1 hypothetical protein [Saprospiraceae bacterium]
MFLLAATPMGELLKLPLLVHHLVTHLEEEPEMSLAEFFKMHYNQGIVIDEDYHQDMQLPFKSVPSNVCFILGDIHGLPLMEMTPMPGKIGKEKIRVITPDLPSSFLSRIWQPPRLS